MGGAAWDRVGGVALDRPLRIKQRGWVWDEAAWECVDAHKGGIGYP